LHSITPDLIFLGDFSPLNDDWLFFILWLSSQVVPDFIHLFYPRYGAVYSLFTSASVLSSAAIGHYSLICGYISTVALIFLHHLNNDESICFSLHSTGG
ncbi:MAG: hypothetical protein ACRC49_06500, partial [Plesiomonas sp.]